VGGSAPITYTYAWLRCNDAGLACVLIPGATAKGYTIAGDDRGHRLGVMVTGRNGSGSTAATSAATEVVSEGGPSTTTTTTTLPGLAEICGNCRDDDGNGLVDDLDPACCPDPLPLLVRRVRVRTGAGGAARARLQLRLDLDRSFAAADPTVGPVSVQLGDGDGPVLCTSLAPWRRSGRRFRHRGAGAGVTSGVLRTRRRKVVFAVAGRHVDLATLSPPELTVAVRVGPRCAQSRATLVQKGRRLVGP
jgi:hypothetical protein